MHRTLWRRHCGLLHPRAGGQGYVPRRQRGVVELLDRIGCVRQGLRRIAGLDGISTGLSGLLLRCVLARFLAVRHRSDGCCGILADGLFRLGRLRGSPGALRPALERAVDHRPDGGVLPDVLDLGGSPLSHCAVCVRSPRPVLFLSHAVPEDDALANVAGGGGQALGAFAWAAGRCRGRLLVLRDGQFESGRQGDRERRRHAANRQLHLRHVLERDPAGLRQGGVLSRGCRHAVLPASPSRRHRRLGAPSSATWIRQSGLRLLEIRFSRQWTLRRGTRSSRLRNRQHRHWSIRARGGTQVGRADRLPGSGRQSDREGRRHAASDQVRLRLVLGRRPAGLLQRGMRRRGRRHPVLPASASRRCRRAAARSSTAWIRQSRLPL